jgi:hypothetical protein
MRMVLTVVTLLAATVAPSAVGLPVARRGVLDDGPPVYWSTARGSKIGCRREISLEAV